MEKSVVNLDEIYKTFIFIFFYCLCGKFLNFTDVYTT